MPNYPHDKTGGTLEFSDMVDPTNPRAGDPTETTKQPASQSSETSSSQSTNLSTPNSTTSSNDSVDKEFIPNQSAFPRSTSQVGAISINDANSTNHSLTKINNSSPLFHNPLAASSQGHLAEFGAKLSKTTLLSNNQTAQLVPIRLNLSPLYDSFQHYGLQVSTPNQATTLLGKIALLLKLDQLKSKHTLRYAAVGLVSFAVFLLIFNFQTIGVQLSYWLNPPKPSAPVINPQISNPPNQQAGASLAEPAPPGNVIIIPKLNVNVPLILEPSINEAAIQKSLEKGVVHYAGTALPGERSNIVVVGHSSNDWWEPGNYKFVFALLDKLAVGDQIQVNYEQRKYVFQVTGSKVVEPTEISVLQPTSEPQLTLITCTPPGTSWKRLIINTKQIAPLYNSDPNKGQIAEASNPNQAALPGNAPSLLDQIKGWLGFGPKNSPPVTATPAAPTATPRRNYLPDAV